jgi:hypothetical protein
MSCRVAMAISPPWSARRDRPERVTLRVTLSGGANVTQVTCVGVCREASPTPLRIADQPGAKTARERKLHDQGLPGAKTGRAASSAARRAAESTAAGT